MALEILKWNKDAGEWEIPELGVDKLDLAYVEIKTINGSSLSGSGDLVVSGSDATKLAILNNLSDLNNASTARTNLGLGNVNNTSDANKPVSTAQQTALDLKVDENAPITGATKTKITYDAKGLVTAGADATTADIADSTNKRYVTDADLTDIGNLSGVNTGDQTSIVGITGTKAQFNTACSDGNFLYVGDVSTYTHPNHSGDVTSVGDGAQTIANDAVTNAKLANMADQRIKGNNAGSTGDPLDLTVTEVTAMLNVFTASLKGLVPLSGGGTDTFLRADGTFASPVLTAADIAQSLLAPSVNETIAAGSCAYVSGYYEIADTKVLEILNGSIFEIG